MPELDAFHQLWGDSEVIWWGASTDLVESKKILKSIVYPASPMPRGCGWFACYLSSGEIAGNVMLQPLKSMPGEIEIGWHFNRAHQGNGYATEAAEALLKHAFKQLHVHSILALIAPDNTPSLRVAEKTVMKQGEHIIYDNLPHDVWSIHRTAIIRG